MRIALTGASGLLGQALRADLTAAGHRVTRLVRSREAAGAADAVYWSPARGDIDGAGLEDHDGVVHLAGESIFGVWTPARKARIRDSRVQGTALLARTLAALERPPRVLVSASGVNYYGDRPHATVDESTPPGQGFLADVAVAWERAAEPAAEAGIRTVWLRSGIVLSPRGGMLALLAPLFRLGLGGRVGAGRQPMPWITLPDSVSIALRALNDAGLQGPVNVVAPDRVSFRDFVATLARVLHRPAPFVLPAALARLAPGGMADELILAGADVLPRRLQEIGYPFIHPRLEPALRALLTPDRR